MELHFIKDQDIKEEDIKEHNVREENIKNKQNIINDLKKLNEIQSDLLEIINDQNIVLDNIEKDHNDISSSLLDSDNVLDKTIYYKSNSKSIIIGAGVGGTILFTAGIPLILSGYTAVYTAVGISGILAGGLLGKKLN